MALKEVLGEALVAVHQECSFSEMTSGTGTFLRSHTAVRRRSWNTIPLPEQRPVQPSAQHAGEGPSSPSPAPHARASGLGRIMLQVFKAFEEGNLSTAGLGIKKNHHLINQQFTERVVFH